VLEVCHAVVALVDAGAVTVAQPPAAPSTSRSTGGKASRPVVDPEVPYGPGVESPHPGPGPGEPAEDGEVEHAGKGQYLRVFSALREA
jgi:hypothetical protein